MKIRLLLPLLLLAGISLALNVSADSHEGDGAAPPPLAELWVVHPKEGHEAEFEAALKDHITGRKKAGDPRNWDTYTVAFGDEFGTYGIRACCFNWADQDTYIEWGNGTELSTHWNENVHPHVKKYEHYMDVIDWDNSHWPADNADWNFVGVTTWKPKPGEEQARSAAIKLMSTTAKENGWGRRWVWLRSIGGPANLSIAVPYKNHADMEPPEMSFSKFMAKHTDEETAASTMQAFSASFWSSEYTVYQLRRDLSTPRDE